MKRNVVQQNVELKNVNQFVHVTLENTSMLESKHVKTLSTVSLKLNHRKSDSTYRVAWFSLIWSTIFLGHNFEDSKVLENQGSGLRQNLLHLLNGVTQKGYWYKCFRASEHKFLSAEFHKYCDNKGPTVTIVRSGVRLFGGYTDLSWDGK